MVSSRAVLLLGTLAVPAVSTEATSLLLTRKEWAELKSLVAALSTEEGSRDFFRKTYRLSQGFSSEAHFLEYVAPWRPSLRLLPDQEEQAGEVVELRVIEKREGLSIYLTFFRDKAPPGDLVFLRTTWVNGELIQVNFLKGSSAIRAQP